MANKPLVYWKYQVDHCHTFSFDTKVTFSVRLTLDILSKVSPTLPPNLFCFVGVCLFFPLISTYYFLIYHILNLFILIIFHLSP